MREEPKQEDRDAQVSEQKDYDWWSAVKEFVKDNDWWIPVKEFLLKNPPLLLTVLYLYITAIGMFYSWLLYGLFGINIFDYSEISDFILAGFKNPWVIFTVVFQVIVSLTVLAVTLLLVMKLAKKWPTKADEETKADEKRFGPFWGLLMPIILVLLFSLVGCLAHALVAANTIQAGDAPAVDVRYRSFSGSAGEVSECGVALIGATQKVGFFYDEEADRTIVIPQAQIVSIEVPTSKRCRSPSS